MTCGICQRTGKSDRLPQGRKRLDQSVYCDQCWRKWYILRSVTLPVVEPMGVDWRDFER